MVILRARRRSALHAQDVGRLSLRVLPNDIDIALHLNNGVYFSLMDLGRFDLLVRAGIWAQLRKRGWYPVSASETITFRKSLRTWQRFVVETRMIGHDDRAVYVEQRFVVDGELYAKGFIKSRFLKRDGGIVTMEELLQLVGSDTLESRLPEWLSRWSADVALPSAKDVHPSDWE
jgi:acyl-CoA thioesterase FadM